MPTPTTNAVRLLLRLLAAPNRFTRTELAKYLGVAKADTVTTSEGGTRLLGWDGMGGKFVETEIPNAAV